MTSPQKRGAVTRRINLLAKQQAIAKGHGFDSMLSMLTILAPDYPTPCIGELIGAHKATARLWLKMHGIDRKPQGGANNPGGYAKGKGNGRKSYKPIVRKTKSRVPVCHGKQMWPADHHMGNWYCHICRHYKDTRGKVNGSDTMISRHGTRGHAAKGMMQKMGELGLCEDVYGK